MPKPWLYLFVFLTASVILVFLASFSLADSRLHIVFCNVGQGDAALIYRGQTQVLIDGGPDSSVLSCLSKHMPFWDREIEVVTMTHPQDDHYGGLVDVVRRYKVELFLAPPADNNTQGFKTLKREVEDRRIRVMNPKTGDILRNGLIQIETIWPSGEWLALNTESRIENLPAPLRLARLGESRILGAATAKADLNEFSIIQKVSFGDFDALFTGDIEPPAEDLMAQNLTGGVEVLKVPHHGSKNGLDKALLDAAMPKLAVISVGKKNRYGHPHKEALKLLEEGGMRVLRTDLDGEVEIVTDGKRWGVK